VNRIRSGNRERAQCLCGRIFLRRRQVHACVIYRLKGVPLRLSISSRPGHLALHLQQTPCRLGTILSLPFSKVRSKSLIEDIAEPDWEELRKADIIGISSITSTAPRPTSWQEVPFRGHSVVMGGPHPFLRRKPRRRLCGQGEGRPCVSLWSIFSQETLTMISKVSLSGG
jgi:hypothetical protein